MDIIDKISRKLGLSESDDEKEIEKDSDEKVEESKTETKEEIHSTPSPKPKSEEPHRVSNILDFNLEAATRNENTSARPVKSITSEIRTVKPKNFEEAQAVSNILSDQIAVIVSFEETEAKEATRIFDFLCGTTHAIGGRMKQVSPKVFIFAPKNVVLSSPEDEKKNVSFDY